MSASAADSSAILRNLIAVSCLLVFALGCSNGVVSQLEGEWVGTPQPTAGEEANVNTPQSDWQKYDVAVEIRFLSDSRVELTMEGRPDTIKADWRVVEQSPASLLLEFATEPAKPALVDSAEQDSSIKEKPQPVLRRFELLPRLEEDKLVGFIFNEARAERQVGELYFVRKGKETKTETVANQSTN
ncbi:hypothetical protein [Adhaeretor mobilis]|uniref:Uncharacterized protein n=1 Tax=Adhaeretor mobilis TaxID=1930276 RepID=A0A517N0N7_9BACT|nr:hypothetical protein [Adhaeretor mobilis]QDT00702.1 hypothetical protein HG15A2_40420 [Adhaeretor mobilis]